MAARDSNKNTSLESEFPGWVYRLSPELVLGNRLPKQPDDSSETYLRIRSNHAFPLGHPTTRLCLDLLTEALTKRQVLNLLEVGCGSGVLCVAAAALGAGQVTGLDIAWEAVQATRENARNNGLDGVIGVLQGSTECLQGRFDLVMANLPWEIQVAKVTELHRLAAAGGRLLLSGFRDNQEEVLGESYQGLGWLCRRRAVKYFSHPEMPPYLSFNWVAWLLEREGPGQLLMCRRQTRNI
ncbi:MAG: methyltransferase domain-containing protein [Deltaproteobacteria bacterium]|nr:methyltransferase domain-containing protein [Deltaproteobacteria bacterium]